MLATKKVDSLPSKCGGIRMRLCFLMRSKRRIRMCSTSCYRSWTMAASPMAKGRQVDFKNTVIIMTSNLGSSYLQSESIRSAAAFEEASKQVLNALHGHFRAYLSS